MAYARQPLPVSDFAAGIAYVNQLRDNQQALVDLYDAKHVIDAGSRYGRIGQHDDPLVARSAQRWDVDPTTMSADTGWVDGPFQTALWRTGVGQWYLVMPFGVTVGATGLAPVTGADLRVVLCSTNFYSTTQWTGWQVAITTWNVSTAALEDFPFAVQLWSI